MRLAVAWLPCDRGLVDHGPPVAGERLREWLNVECNASHTPVR
ncbi:hypothetical protein F750_0053 [Streptomyces sp. PAMC 26508]|nr:hypothetical protein F750_0053 [Streptomyces sp. PAMC 26508]